VNRLRSVFGLGMLLGAVACGGPEASSVESAPPRLAASEATPSTPRSRPAGTPRIVFLGDSLTAGLGLPVDQSFPALIQERLDREGYDYEVVNSGVSGDTSAGGLRRLEWALEGNVRVLVVALGANDGLRGLSPDQLKKNLTAIVDTARGRGLAIVVAGMEAPPNNGPEYTAAFRQVFLDVAARQDVAFVPFLLQGVAGDAAYNQSDGIHPNARGAQVVAETVWRALAPALTRRRNDLTRGGQQDG
jgi:acyl-CoA thioesterase-1